MTYSKQLVVSQRQRVLDVKVEGTDNGVMVLIGDKPVVWIHNKKQHFLRRDGKCPTLEVNSSVMKRIKSKHLGEDDHPMYDLSPLVEEVEE